MEATIEQELGILPPDFKSEASVKLVNLNATCTTSISQGILRIDSESADPHHPALLVVSA